MFENAKYLDDPLEKAPIFSKNEKLEQQLKIPYVNNFSQLVYKEAPDFEKVMGTLFFIREHLSVK